MQNEPELIIDEDGNKYWFLNDLLHREDGPAIEYIDGTKRWFLNNCRHRGDGPAIEFSNGSKLWYLNGKIHRTDGPAIEYANGDKYWCLNNTGYTFEKWLKLTPLSEQEKNEIEIEIWTKYQ